MGLWHWWPAIADIPTETLGLKKQKIIVVTSSGNININLRVFSSPQVEPWILTGEEGEEKLRLQLKTMEQEKRIKIVCLAGGPRIDLSTATQLLRQEHGIRTLLCEGGPTLYGELLNKRLIDEDFRTISLQVLGESTNRQIERPTSYGSVSYTPETAPWFRLISIHYALPHHVFFRLRYVGPRTLQDWIVRTLPALQSASLISRTRLQTVLHTSDSRYTCRALDCHLIEDRMGSLDRSHQCPQEGAPSKNGGSVVAAKENLHPKHLW
jgi:riboflavin biosynthesis pyrimidine reductase